MVVQNFETFFDAEAEPLAREFLDLVKIPSSAVHPTPGVQYVRPSSPDFEAVFSHIQERLGRMRLNSVLTNSTLYVTLEASPGVDAEDIGFVAHVDTSPDAPGTGIEPRVFTYDGGVVTYPKGPSNLVLNPGECQDLTRHIGRKIIVTSGDTLLGADDKSGVTVLLRLFEYFTKHPEVKHPRIVGCFTCDEEIGYGVEGIVYDRLPLRLITLDGGDPWIIENETFHAFHAAIRVNGHVCHPGHDGYGRMVNAMEVFCRVQASLNIHDVPRFSKGRQGFIHLTNAKGDCSSAEGEFIIRDFNKEGCERRAQVIRDAVTVVQLFYNDPNLTIDVAVKEQYPNMKPGIDRHPELVKWAVDAITASGMQPEFGSIRGGTDGSKLTIDHGRPTINLGVGMKNFHSPLEWVGLDDMVRALQVCINLCMVVVSASRVATTV